MKVLLLEDDKRMINHFSEIVVDTLEDVRVFKTMSGKSALKIIENEDIDLMIFDMELDEEKKVLGLDYANMVAETHTDIDFMIISGYSNYFEDSNSVKPYYYFMKPLDEDFFRRKLLEWEVIRKSIKANKVSSIRVKTKDGMSLISLNNVIYLEKVNRHVRIKTLAKEYITKTSLKNIMKLLDERFYETHQSFIVNIEAVSDLRLRENRTWEIVFHEAEETALLSRYKSKPFITKLDELRGKKQD